MIGHNPPANSSDETAICVTPFTLTEQISGNSVSYSYAAGDTIPERHIRYASNVRRVKKGAPEVVPSIMPEATPTASIMVKPQNMKPVDVVRLFGPLAKNYSLAADTTGTVVTLKGDKQTVEAAVMLIEMLDEMSAGSNFRTNLGTPRALLPPTTLPVSARGSLRRPLRRRRSSRLCCNFAASTPKRR